MTDEGGAGWQAMLTQEANTTATARGAILLLVMIKWTAKGSCIKEHQGALGYKHLVYQQFAAFLAGDLRSPVAAAARAPSSR